MAHCMCTSFYFGCLKLENLNLTRTSFLGQDAPQSFGSLTSGGAWCGGAAARRPPAQHARMLQLFSGSSAHAAACQWRCCGWVRAPRQAGL
jgi:hypothetical protein